jgi:hypothetical protein
MEVLRRITPKWSSISVVPALDLDELEQHIMYELLSKFEPGHFIGLVAVAGGLTCGLVAIVMGIGLEMHRVNIAASLKKNMLDRGMTAEEIRMVMEASTKDPDHLCKGPVEAEV